MPTEDKWINSDSHPGKPTGSPTATPQVASTNSGQVNSPGPKHYLGESDEKLRAIVNQVIVGIVQADLAGRITFVNDRYCEITGYPREELLGKQWQDFTHPDDLPQNGKFFEQITRGESPLPFEKRYMRKNGNACWVTISGSALRNAAGEVLGELAVVVDITERKRAEEELRIAAIAFQAQESIMVTDASGVILRVNDAFTRMTGYSAEEAVGKTPSLLKSGLHDEKFFQDMWAAIRQEHYWQGETWNKRKDGTIYMEWQTISAVLAPDGNVSHYIGTFIDITERKRLEKELQERRKEMNELQKLHVAAQTASAIAHELNQPLMAIASYSGAARMLLQAEVPNLDKIRNAIEGSERQAQRAGQSIRELIEFLSIKEFSTEAFDLNQEVRDVLDTARSEHELQFHSIFQPEARRLMVRANHSHVQRVLLNLLHNGIEAMQEAGVLLPSIIVTVRTLKDGNAAQVTIQDNGPGVRKQDLQRLFEPFFSTKASGIGMGLAISRSLIEANGGQLWVDPHETPGATFHFTLPLAT
jgi:two-component system sensor kinase FixL